ncbi:MAG: F0F1 ATP synthase subunit B [Spirosomataceae bacterium]
MQLLTPELGLIFWQLVVFLGLVFVLGKYAWKPILSSLNEREQSIQDALDLAKKARQEMAELKAGNEKLLAEARAERDSIIKQAKETSDKMIADAKNNSLVEAKKIIDDARQSIQNEKVAAIAQIKKEVATLSLEIAEKVLRSELSDKKSQEKLVNDLVADARLN